MRATELIHENICKGIVVSKRDLYYRDVVLFGSQLAVDNIAEDLACTLQVPRSCLNVVAGIRSMVYGSVRLVISARYQKTESAKGTDDTCLNETSSRTAYNTLVVIPALMNDVLEIEIHPSTRFILVVEKEAAMEYLISSGFCSTHGPCILLTSKGYPDKVVRQLLKYLSDMIDAGVHTFSPFPTPSRDVSFGSWGDLSSPGRQPPLDIPLLAFVDCDPHGIEIYLTYRCGSILSAYDNANLAVPKLACLGQIPNDWNIYLTGEKSHLSDQFQRLMITLSPRDRSKLVNMLKQHPYVRRNRAWTRQISMMLMMNRKTELESLSLSETCHENLERGRDADDPMGQIGGDSLIQYLERKLQDPRLWI
ncbi:Spo11/DNA topoisomerase VI subunit A [Dissophora ornata]|nr:Spo11/DNA topoisomerase VI subunit A [Dissophora ornata]